MQMVMISTALVCLFGFVSVVIRMFVTETLIWYWPPTTSQDPLHILASISFVFMSYGTSLAFGLPAKIKRNRTQRMLQTTKAWDSIRALQKSLSKKEDTVGRWARSLSKDFSRDESSNTCKIDRSLASFDGNVNLDADFEELSPPGLSNTDTISV